MVSIRTCVWLRQRRQQKQVTGIEDIIINDHYLIVIAISILFTMLTIFRRTVLLDTLTWVCWFIAGAMHLMASPSTTPFYIISILYWGFGLIFFVIMWVDLFQLFKNLESTKGVGPL